VTSLSGAPIHRHGEATPWEPPHGEECIEEISAHVEKHLGPIEKVFHEIVSDTVHVDVHFVEATIESPFSRLVTSGMSDLPMKTPKDSSAPTFIELLITLPREWQFSQESFKDEAWYWPVRLIKTLALLPHKYQTWLGFGHSVPNGDPPQAYAPNTRLCGAILLPSVTVPSAFHNLNVPGRKEIRFYAVVPLYEPEMNLKLRSGTDALLERFERKNVTDVVSIRRKDVTNKLLGIW
jgi:hypothetical protein